MESYLEQKPPRRGRGRASKGVIPYQPPVAVNYPWLPVMRMNKTTLVVLCWIAFNEHSCQLNRKR
jgi:hypothetical protein